MIIDRKFRDLVINSGASIIDALGAITKNRLQFVICLNGDGKIDSVLTDGDFRRWVAEGHGIDLTQPVGTIANKTFLTRPVDTSSAVLAGLLSEQIAFIPLVDDQGRLVAVARRSHQTGFSIEGRRVGPGEPSFIIAEIGINHNGSLATAKQLVDAAVRAGADCAKFQMRDMTSLYLDGGQATNVSADLGAQYTLDMLARSQLTPEEMEEAFDYCRQRGILPMCTPWDLPSAARLVDYGIPVLKIASADLTNHDLLRATARSGRPIVLSTGMSTEDEIIESCGVLRDEGANFVVLHCNSTYPAPFKDVNLAYLERLQRVAGCPVGYSGHERGFAVAIAAVARGASVIEKHITLDRSMLGNDHKVSLEPDEFTAMVQAIRDVEEALGRADARRISPGERMNRETLAKSLVAASVIEPGTVISESMIAVMSPGTGLQPNRRRELVGQTAKRLLKPGDCFFPSDLQTPLPVARAFNFRRPWGIPVRYHDWRALHGNLPMDFLEFHFSYRDLEVDIPSFLDAPLPMRLVTHSPDLFPDDHILNLASDDAHHRETSIRHLQRVIDVTRQLARWFPRTERVPIIASLGGMSRDAALPVGMRDALYARIADSLSQLDTTGVEILPQTLPPFPWYLGGQLHCNLFVDPEDTAAFCRATNMRLCFDTSHSKLAANTRKRDFREFIDLLAPLAGHLHIVDAAGVDGEGVQIDEGEIEFDVLCRELDRLCPGIAFIPEIWQGHKNGGEGFWIALDRLEGRL